MVLAPMCSPSSDTTSLKGRNPTLASLSNDCPPPKLGQSVCSNPVLTTRMSQDYPKNADQTPLQGAISSCFSISRSLRSCEFITFKGLSESQYGKEFEGEPKTFCSALANNDQLALTTGKPNKGSEVPKSPMTPSEVDFHAIDLPHGKQALFAGSLVAPSSNNNSKQGGHDGSLPPKAVPNADPKPPFKFAGIVGGLITTLFFSISVFAIKLLPNCNTIEEKVKANWYRGLFMTMFCTIAIIYQGSTFKVRRDEILMNIIRTFFGYFGSLGAYVSLQYITIGESTALIYASTLWTAILGYLVLHESFPLTMLVAIPLGFLGIMFIAHPDFILGKSLVEQEVLDEVERQHHLNQYLTMLNVSTSADPQLDNLLNESAHLAHHHELKKRQVIELISNINSTAARLYEETLPAALDGEVVEELYLQARWPGVLVSLGTSFIVAIVYITLKFRKSTPIQTVTFYLGVGTVTMSTILQCFIGFGTFPTTILEWVLLSSIGLFSWAGQAIMQWSFQYEKVSVLSIVRTFDIVLGFFWSVALLHEDILWTSVLGAILITSVVIILVLNDQIERLFCSRCRK